MDARPPQVIAAVSTGAAARRVLETAQEYAARTGGEVIALNAAGGTERARAVLAEARRREPTLIVIEPGPDAVIVARGADAPVLVARESPPGAVIGASDLSEEDVPALRVAAREATARTSRVCFFHAVATDWITALTGDNERSYSRVLDAQLNLARRRLNDHAQTLCPEVDIRISAGDPITHILQTATQLRAALLVVATRRRTKLASLVHRCPVEQLVLDAPCSVLVVRKRRRSPRAWLADQLLTP